jgi:hypothetical protein
VCLLGEEAVDYRDYSDGLETVDRGYYSNGSLLASTSLVLGSIIEDMALFLAATRTYLLCVL